MIKKMMLALGKRGNLATQSAQSPGRAIAAIRQGGFTLIEMVVTLSIIAVLAGLISTQFSGDSSKATKLLADMTSLKNSLNRAKFDMGGFPTRLDTLWDRTEATPGQMTSGVAGVNTWAGPYAERLPHTAGVLDMRTLADGVTVAFVQEAGSSTNGSVFGTTGKVYSLTAANVPRGIAAEFMKKCSGNDSVVGTPATFITSNCRIDGIIGEVVQVSMRVADSR